MHNRPNEVLTAMMVHSANQAPKELFNGVITARFYDGVNPPCLASLTLVDAVIDVIVVSDDAGDCDASTAAQWDGPLIVPGFIDVHNHGGAGGGFPTGTA